MSKDRKVRFFDHKDAVRALHRIQSKVGFGAEKQREQRSYECPFCRGWHLTSQPDKDGLVDPVQLVPAATPGSGAHVSQSTDSRAFENVGSDAA
jgi:hypothetical protein